MKPVAIRMLGLNLLNLIVLVLSLQCALTEEDLPVDGHFSSQALPLEFSSSTSCSCDRTPSCVGESCGARIFYLVGIHNNRTLNDALYLFRAIRDARNTILIHLDIKFGMADYNRSVLRQEIEECPCGSRVEAASVHNATWSSWSMNLPTLWAMEKAVKEYHGKWDVFINLSGDTLPVYTPNRIAHLFSGPLAGINFITSSVCATGLSPSPITYFPKHWHKRAHYSYHPAHLDYVDDDGKSHSNVTLETYFGSQWISLQPEWCQFLIRQLGRTDSLASQFRHYLKVSGKLMTDETFIPTLLMHYFPETTPNLTNDHWLDTEEVDMYSIRYERMDEHTPDSTGMFPTEQRYEVPKSSGVDVPRPWGPYFLGVYDLANIRYSGALYIRKVATAIDENLFHLLPVDTPEQIPAIEWPREVQISPVPNWEKKLEAMRKKHKKELEEKHAKENDAESTKTIEKAVDGTDVVTKKEGTEAKNPAEPKASIGEPNEMEPEAE
jgi:hypothetical protein